MNVNDIRFDLIVNKDMFNFEDVDEFEWYFKTLYYESTEGDFLKNDSIMIITDREPKELASKLLDMFNNSEYYIPKKSYISYNNNCIYCDNIEIKDKEIRVLIISANTGENVRCWRNKAVILDINKEDTKIRRELLERCIFPTLICYDEDKLSHGRIAFIKNKNLVNFIE